VYDKKGIIEAFEEKAKGKSTKYLKFIERILIKLMKKL